MSIELQNKRVQQLRSFDEKYWVHISDFAHLNTMRHSWDPRWETWFIWGEPSAGDSVSSLFSLAAELLLETERVSMLHPCRGKRAAVNLSSENIIAALTVLVLSLFVLHLWDSCTHKHIKPQSSPTDLQTAEGHQQQTQHTLTIWHNSSLKHDCDHVF